MMERHPLTFLVVLLMIGALSGVQISLLILLHRRLPAVRKLLLDVRDNTDDLIKDGTETARRRWNRIPTACAQEVLERDQRENHS